MLSFKKAAVLAVFIIIGIYLIHSSQPSSGSAQADLFSKEPSPTPDVVKDTVVSTGVPSEKDLARKYPPPKPDSLQKGGTQQPLAEVVTKSLREQLQYLFPYDRQGKFPAYIWQTWKVTPSSGDFPEQFRPAEASWSELHPGFTHEVLTDKDSRVLLSYLYGSVPEVLDAYEALPSPVMKADFFRYLILLARGGIYSDIDTTALKSTTDWLPADVPRSTIGLVVGIEADPDRADWKDWYSRRIQFCQWTIQAKSGHPVLRDVVATITEETLKKRKKGPLSAKKMHKNIIEFTGPAVWTDAIFSYLNNPVYFKMEGKNVTWQAFTGIESSKKVGDVVVLPITSFSPGVGQMGAKEPDDPMAFVKHEFEGKLIETCNREWQSLKHLM